MSDEAGPAPKPASAAALSEADAKFERGIQCIRANDTETAVQLFAEVLELRTQHYGELALECATAYYRYGAALLYQAQDNDDVFGASMKEAGEGEGEEAEEEEPAGDKENSRDKGKGPVAPDAEEEDGEEGGEEGEGGENDLQLAWENLESAKVIWGRQGEGQHSEQLADVHSLLGDVAMESDDFPTALAELDAALAHLLAFVQPDDRRIAEVQYKRCCALQLGGDAEAALPAVQAACDCLVLRQQALASKLTAVNEGPEAEKLTAEQADVAALLQDLKEKVQELEAMAAENADTKAMIKNTFAQFAAGNNAGAQAKPAEDGGGGGTADVGGSGTATDSGVQNLGVVGRGTKRINLQAVQTNVPGALPGGGAGAPAGEPLPKKKRSLAELMGDDEGKTSIGFGQAPAPVAACEAAPAAATSCAEGSGVLQAVPSFLQAASVQAVYGKGAQADPPPAQT